MLEIHGVVSEVREFKDGDGAVKREAKIALHSERPSYLQDSIKIEVADLKIGDAVRVIITPIAKLSEAEVSELSQPAVGSDG